MALDGAAGRGGARSRLVWLLATLAAVAVGASAVLVFWILPLSSRLSREAISEVAAIGDLEISVTAQGDDERAFLLTGDEAFLRDFDSRSLSVASATERLRELGSGPERAMLDRAHASYARFVVAHAQVVRLARQGDHAGAVALALGAAGDRRREAENDLHQIHEAVARESRRELERNHRQAVALTVVLLVLSFGPAAAAFVLGRTLRRRADDEAVVAERRRLAEAQRIAQLGSWENDLGTGGVTWSDELYRILGYRPAEIEASLEAFLELVHPDDVEAVAETIRRGIETHSPFEFVNRIVRSDGQVRWLASQGEVTLGADGQAVAVVGTALDVTDRQEAAEQVREARDRLARQEAEMRHRAFHDSLTGLANRALLLDRLAEALGEAPSAAVLLLDLDGFKRINDSLGHSVGDRLLTIVGERLVQSMRGEPQPGDAAAQAAGRVPDTVARLGGDEFAVLLVGVDEAGAVRVAERILDECGEPVRLDGRELAVSASVGVAMASWASSPLEALRDADVAMYTAKAAGGGRFTLFDPAMHEAVVERLMLEAELKAAIESGGLVLHYQPIVDPVTGVVVKVEALVRWPHPTRGFLPPDTFIPLAEETGLIVSLGAWVLDEACDELARQSDRRPDLRMAVNLSGRQLEELDLPSTVAAALARAGVEPARLVLEVTESLLVERGPWALAALEELRALGVGLAIDDFGTGYSSLGRLRTLPVDQLKIDKSFIDEIDEGGDRAPVIAAVIALAHSLGHLVVAEGVETVGQLVPLMRLGCDLVQGYLMSRPLPANELRELLAFPAPFSAVAPPDAGDAALVDREVMAAVARAVEGAGGEPAEAGAAIRPLLAELAKLTGLESTYLTRIDFGRGEQEIVVAHNSGALRVEEGACLAWEDSPCRQALARGPRATEDVPTEFADSAVAAELGIQGYAMAPVTTGTGGVIGTLCAATAGRHPVGAGTVALLQLFSRMIGDALQDEETAVAARSLRVVIADDNEMVRGLLIRLLRVGGFVEVVAEAADGEEAVAACRRERPDVVLLDLEMPTLGGLAAIPRLRQASPSTKIVVLSAEGESRRVEALAAGAAAVVDKLADPAYLRSVLTAVA